MLQLNMHVFWPAFLCAVFYLGGIVHFSIKVRQDKREDALFIYAYMHLGIVVSILFFAVVQNF